MQGSIGKPFWDSSLFLLHRSLRISGACPLVLTETRLSCSLALQSLAHTSECVNHRDEHQTWLCHHKALGRLPGPPIVAAEFRGWGGLHLLPGQAQPLSLCPAPCPPLSQFPFSFYACYLAPPWASLFLSWPVSLFLWPLSLGPCSLSLTLPILSSPGCFFFLHSCLPNSMLLPHPVPPSWPKTPTHRCGSSLQPAAL